MLKVLVIADDFTGANDTGALLGQLGLSVHSAPAWPLSGRWQDSSQVLCINSDSRSMTAKSARQIVHEIAKSFRRACPDILLSKRIDTTLRGNVGAEIDGLLDALPDGCRAVVVPSCPRAGRICVGGYILVNGVLLGNSHVAEDPRTPVTQSNVETIIRLQSGREIASISTGTVKKGSLEICKALKNITAPVIVIDAADQTDIHEIAHGCISAGISMACVDPGDFTKAYANARKMAAQKDPFRNLLVIGSLAKASVEQVDDLKESGKTYVYHVNVERLLNHPLKELEEALTQFAEAAGSFQNFCLTTMNSKRLDWQAPRKGCQMPAMPECQAPAMPECRVPTMPEYRAPIMSECRAPAMPECQTPAILGDRAPADAIAFELSRLAAGIIRGASVDFAAVYLSGGDVAKAFVLSIGAKRLEILDELMPLAVWGRLIGGEMNGLSIITKGGMIGNRDAIRQLLEHVEKRNCKDGKTLF